MLLFSCPTNRGDAPQAVPCIVDKGGDGCGCLRWREGESVGLIKISSGGCPPSAPSWLKLSSIRSSIHILNQKQMKYLSKFLYLPTSILVLNHGLCWPEICSIGKLIKIKKMQGLKSDIAVISASGPSHRSQSGESSATERSSMETSWNTGGAWGQISQDLLPWLPTGNSQEMSHRVRECWL